MVCGTDTLGVGINVPIRTVMFTGLTKFDGVRQRHLKVREFLQIAGRAGRAGFDTAGTVVVQAPDHEVENERLLARAGDDERKRKRIVRKKPPEGQVSWGRATFERLSSSPPEPLTSQFAVSHAMVLNVVARPGDAQAAMRHLLTENDDDPAAKERLTARTEEIWQALAAAGVIEPLDPPDAEGRTVRLTVDLQANFALNQPLSPFALAAFDVLDRESPSYALDLVSVIESTLDDPRPVLSAQRFKARGEAVAEMKAEGIDYDERMELLDDVTHPKPLDELLQATFAIYASGHPWVLDHELSPKSVARDMFERAMTFSEYVAFYGLARSEGLVLRYLSDVVKALRQTVPDAARTEEIADFTEWLGEVVRQVDSSLLDEWEALRSGVDDPALLEAAEHRTGAPPVTANPRAFRVLVRNALFRRVELASREQYQALGELEEEVLANIDEHPIGNAGDAPAIWTQERWAAAMDAYYQEHDRLGTGPDARGPKLLIIDELPGRWEVRQIFDDPAGDHDWGISAVVDLATSDAAGTAVVHVIEVNRLG